MPKALINPRWRNLVLQLVLWMLLLATVGLAMLVTRQRRLAMRAQLDPPMTCNLLEARLARGWIVRSGNDAGDYIIASEPSTGQITGRELRIYRQRSGGLISPIEHLLRKGFLSQHDLGPEAAHVDTEDLKIAGWPAVMVTRTHPSRGEEAQILACAVFPNSQAIVIELDVNNPNGPDDADGDLVRQIADETGVVGQAVPPDAGGTAQLSETISVSVPAQFALLPDDDPNLKSRQLLATQGKWMAVDLIPCLYFSDDDASALQTLLMAHDPRWRGKAPEKLTGRRGWRCDRAEGDNPFPSRAYLLCGDDEQAVLAIFRGGPHEENFDGAFESIADSIHFTARHDIAAMLTAGSADVQRLRKEDLDQWLPESGTREWSAWDSSENAAPRPWLTIDWQRLQSGQGYVWRGTRNTFPLDPYGATEHFKVDWTCSGDGAQYTSEAWATPDSGNSLPTELRLKLTVEGETMQMQTPSLTGGAAGTVLPAQFIPGGILPLVVGKLSQTPMILRTESSVDCEGIAPPSLLTIVTLPAADAPVKRDEKGDALHSLSMTVNGSGRISRWYFTDAGDVRYITFTGDHTALEQKRP